MSKRHAKRRQPRRFVPTLRRLEDRTVPAGNVTAMAFEGILYVVGDNANNQIWIAGTSDDSVEIRSLDGSTLINGQTSVSISGTHGGFHVLMNGGDDMLSLSGVNARRNLNIDMGDGNDGLMLFGVIASRTSNFITGAGDDQVVIMSSSLYRDSVIDTGAGNDKIMLGGSQFYRNTYVNGGDGFNTFSEAGDFFHNLVTGNVNNGNPPNPPPTTPAPVANNDTANVTRGGTVNINVAANDTATAPATLNLGSITITGGPMFGTAVPNANGTVTYTNTNTATTSHVDSFQYTIRDSNGTVSNSATVTIAISDTTQPTVTITTTAPNPTNTSPIPFTFAFSQVVNGFTQGKINVTNGTVTNFTRVDATTYRIEVTPTGPGDVSVSLPANSVTNNNGVGNAASNTVTVTFQATAPTVTINTLTTNNPTPTLTGTVSDPNATVVVMVGGQTITATVNGNNWSATVPTALADGSYTITATATDQNNNQGMATSDNGLVIDTVAPTATISTTEPDPTPAATIPFTVTFSEDVTGFTETGLTITNGTVSNFVMVDAHTFTFDVTPTADGLVTVQVNAGAAQDAAGNTNPEATFSITSNRTNPIPTITTTASDPTNLAIIPFTVSFNVDVTGFEESDLQVVNGTVSNFVMVDARTYTFDITPTADGLVRVKVPAGVAMDLFGHENLEANFTITSDRTAPPAPVITGLGQGSDSGTPGDGITNVNTPTIVGTAEAGTTVEVFADSGSGPVSLGTTVTDANGDWSLTVATALADGTYTLTAVATDPAGNASPASAAFALTIDTVAPVATITTTEPDPTGANLIPFTVSFSKDVTGFDLSDLTITNGTASNFVMVDAHTYTFDVAPTTNGLVTVTVNADAAQDVAGNGNAEASFSITSDRLVATITTTSPNPTNTALIPVTVTFSADVTGFDETDLVVTNGTVSNFVMVDGHTYTFDLTATAEGDVTVMIPAGVAMDSAGRSNVEANFSITFDSTAPAAPVITGLAQGSDSGTPGDGITNVNTPTIVGTAEAGTTIEVFSDSGSGPVSLGTTVTDANGDWSFTVPTALADGSYTITATATDAAGNVSPSSAAFALTIDTVAPVATITTTEPDPSGANLIPFTVSFSEDVTGFDLSDLTITNGTASNFVMVDAHTYTFDVAPTTNGLVTVTVNADAGQDPAGNGNAEVSFSITSERLLATITTTAPNPTNTALIPVTVTFSADVTGFDQTDLVVTNGTVSNFVMVDGHTYTFDLTATTDGDVTVTIPAGVAMDSGGRSNVEANFSITFDSTAPSPPVITGLAQGSDSGTPGDGITNVTTPTIIGTAEAGATIEVFSDSGSGPVSLGTTVADANGDWSFTVPTALADGSYTITATATDAAGNVGPSSAAFALTIDTVAPVATITTTAIDPSNLASIPFTVTFSENVTGFDLSDVTITNGTASNFVMVDAHTYTFDVAPTGDGLVTVTVNAGAADDAAGNTNAEASFSITSERFNPTATITTTASDPTSLALIPFTVTFSENVTGFTAAGIMVLNGTVSNFVMVDARTYTFDVAPTADGLVTVKVLGGSAHDAFGNANTEATFAITSDRTAPPAPVVNGLDPSTDSGTVGDGITNFTMPIIVGTAEAGSTVEVFANSGTGNHSLGTVTVGAGGTWSFTVTSPLADGAYTITAIATDVAGNASAASAAFTLVIDTSSPTVLFTSNAPPTNNMAIVSFTVTFSEDVVGFTQSGLTVVNGTISDFNMANGHIYTFAVTPTGDGPVMVKVNQAVAQDVAGNSNLGGEYDFVSDRTNPTGTINATSSGAITGTAGDATSGVGSVMVSIFDGTHYWDGTGFNSTTEVFFAATSNDNFATWALAFAGTGSFTVHANITDVAGNVLSLMQTVVVTP